MLLQLLYDGILKTLTYLMPEAYSEPYQMSKIMIYIENLGIARTVNSGIFRHIQLHSDTLRHIKVYSDICRLVGPYSDIYNSCIYNCATFKTFL